MGGRRFFVSSELCEWTICQTQFQFILLHINDTDDELLNNIFILQFRSMSSRATRASAIRRVHKHSSRVRLYALEWPRVVALCECIKNWNKKNIIHRSTSNSKSFTDHFYLCRVSTHSKTFLMRKLSSSFWCTSRLVLLHNKNLCAFVRRVCLVSMLRHKREMAITQTMRGIKIIAIWWQEQT